MQMILENRRVDGFRSGDEVDEHSCVTFATAYNLTLARDEKMAPL